MTRPPELDQFLCEFERQLEGGARHRANVIAEIETHLLEEIDAARGGHGAAARAIHRFGPTASVAGELNCVYRLRRRRRAVRMVGLALVLSPVLAAFGGVVLGGSGSESSLGSLSIDGIDIGSEQGVRVALDPASGRVVGAQLEP